MNRRQRRRVEARKITGEQIMTTQHEAPNRDALLAWTVHLSCVMPDGIDEDCQPVSEAQQMRNACPELRKYSDRQLMQFVIDMYTFGEEHPEADLHRNYIWKPPAGYRGAYHPSWRSFLERMRKATRCSTCGQIVSLGQRDDRS